MRSCNNCKTHNCSLRDVIYALNGFLLLPGDSRNRLEWVYRCIALTCLFYFSVGSMRMKLARNSFGSGNWHIKAVRKSIKLLKDIHEKSSHLKVSLRLPKK